jgi:type I restriction enzyme S subunit
LDKEIHLQISRYIINRDDVYISIAGSIGIVGVIPDELDGANLTENAARIVIKERSVLFRDFLAKYLQSPLGQESIKHRTNIVGQPKLALERIATIEIPLPPLDEQKRIAAILDEQMEAVERSRQATLAQLEAAKALPAVYLRAVFNSPEAQQWERKWVGDILVAPLKTGISKTSLANSEKYCLTLSSVRNGKLDLTASKPVDVSDSEAKGNWVKPGAFYVVRGNGNRSLVGRGALAPSIIPQPILYPDLLIEVNIASEVMEPRYLRWIWDSDIVRKDIENKARTAAGIYKINQANLSAVELLVPSFTKQQIIAVTLDEQMAEVERLQQSLKSQLDAINKLPATLLRRAFNGEL